MSSALDEYRPIHLRVASTAEDKILARYYDSGFAEAKGNYNGISTASDTKVYYVLSTDSLDTGAQMFVFDPRSETIEHVGDPRPRE